MIAKKIISAEAKREWKLFKVPLSNTWLEMVSFYLQKTCLVPRTRMEGASKVKGQSQPTKVTTAELVEPCTYDRPTILVSAQEEIKGCNETVSSLDFVFLCYDLNGSIWKGIRPAIRKLLVMKRVSLFWARFSARRPKLYMMVCQNILWLGTATLTAAFQSDLVEKLRSTSSYASLRRGVCIALGNPIFLVEHQKFQWSGKITLIIYCKEVVITFRFSAVVLFTKLD